MGGDLLVDKEVRDLNSETFTTCYKCLPSALAGPNIGLLMGWGIGSSRHLQSVVEHHRNEWKLVPGDSY